MVTYKVLANSVNTDYGVIEIINNYISEQEIIAKKENRDIYISDSALKSQTNKDKAYGITINVNNSIKSAVFKEDYGDKHYSVKFNWGIEENKTNNNSKNETENNKKIDNLTQRVNNLEKEIGDLRNLIVKLMSKMDF